MTIVPYTYMYSLRRDLSDLPEDYASDALVYQSIDQAWNFIQTVVDIDVASESTIGHCIVALGSYFTYLSYTSLVERRLGDLPQSTRLRLNELKQKAVIFINSISEFQLDENLSIVADLSRIKPNQISYLDSVMDE